MSTVWCDILSVQITADRTMLTVFYAVPFSTGGLTTKRIFDIEAQFAKLRGYSKPLNHVFGFTLLEERQMEEADVERVIERPEMLKIMTQQEKEA